MKIETYIRTKGACLNFGLENRDLVLKAMSKIIMNEEYDRDTMEFGDISFFPATNIFFGKKEIDGVTFYVLFEPQSQLPVYLCDKNDALNEDVVKILREEIFLPGEEKFREMYFRVHKEILDEEKKDEHQTD